MEYITVITSLGSAIGVLAFYQRDPWKANLWVALLLALGCSSLPLTSDSLLLLGKAFSSLLSVTLLAVVTVEAFWGRLQAKKLLPWLLTVAPLVMLMPKDIEQDALVTFIETCGLLLAIIVFFMLEVKHKPGAGWILLGAIAWLIKLWLPTQVVTDNLITIGALLLGLTTLISFMLAVRKQLRLN